MEDSPVPIQEFIWLIGNLEKYKKDLEDSGFKINYTTMAGSSGYLSAMKNNLSVVVMVGEGNATVTIGTGN